MMILCFWELVNVIGTKDVELPLPGLIIDHNI